MSQVAAIYIRNSLSNERCIQEQLTKCRNLAEQQKMEIHSIYIDEDNSFSQLENMLDDLHMFSKLYVASLDRFSRNTKEVLDILDLLNNNNIKIESCEKVVEYTPLMLSIFNSISEFERTMVTERETEGIVIDYNGCGDDTEEDEEDDEEIEVQ
jgi:site-specific DNA recombinase